MRHEETAAFAAGGCSVLHKGKKVDVVAQATKFGFLYVLDRLTGDPLWPVEERPVSQSDMPGEASWPTQPFPLNPPPLPLLEDQPPPLGINTGPAPRDE